MGAAPVSRAVSARRFEGVPAVSAGEDLCLFSPLDPNGTALVSDANLGTGRDEPAADAAASWPEAEPEPATLAETRAAYGLEA